MSSIQPKPAVPDAVVEPARDDPFLWLEDVEGDRALDWVRERASGQAFAEALTGLSKDKYTETPVKSEFGYHVIQLDDSRPANPPPFDQVKPQLQQRASQQQIETLVKELRSKAKVD